MPVAGEARSAARRAIMAYVQGEGSGKNARTIVRDIIAQGHAEQVVRQGLLDLIDGRQLVWTSMDQLLFADWS